MFYTWFGVKYIFLHCETIAPNMYISETKFYKIVLTATTHDAWWHFHSIFFFMPVKPIKFIAQSNGSGPTVWKSLFYVKSYKSMQYHHSKEMLGTLTLSFQRQRRQEKTVLILLSRSGSKNAQSQEVCLSTSAEVHMYAMYIISTCVCHFLGRSESCGQFHEPAQLWPTELSARMEMFHICAVQHTTI